MYFARDDHTRQEFHIERHEENGKTYPKITTKHLGDTYTNVDKRITLEGIYQRYEDLMDALKAAELPDADYMHVYPDNLVEQMFKAGEVAKTKYEKWKTNKDKYPIGYFMCQSYCSYRTMCKAQKEEDGHH
jgi:hypothetical protein